MIFTFLKIYWIDFEEYELGINICLSERQLIKAISEINSTEGIFTFLSDVQSLKADSPIDLAEGI